MLEIISTLANRKNNQNHIFWDFFVLAPYIVFAGIDGISTHDVAVTEMSNIFLQEMKIYQGILRFGIYLIIIILT